MVAMCPWKSRGPRTGHRASEMLIPPETASTPVTPALAALATLFYIPAAVTHTKAQGAATYIRRPWMTSLFCIKHGTYSLVKWRCFITFEHVHLCIQVCTNTHMYICVQPRSWLSQLFFINLELTKQAKLAGHQVAGLGLGLGLRLRLGMQFLLALASLLQLALQYPLLTLTITQQTELQGDNRKLGCPGSSLNRRYLGRNTSHHFPWITGLSSFHDQASCLYGWKS